jgi:hypothetical protein
VKVALASITCSYSLHPPLPNPTGTDKGLPIICLKNSFLGVFIYFVGSRHVNRTVHCTPYTHEGHMYVLCRLSYSLCTRRRVHAQKFTFQKESLFISMPVILICIYFWQLRTTRGKSEVSWILNATAYFHGALLKHKLTKLVSEILPIYQFSSCSAVYFVRLQRTAQVRNAS